MSKTNKIKYFAYVRKSTEGEERQALSISSQMDKVKEFFGSLEIVEVLEEKHSAFKPYNRPVFADMIKRIQNGEASGIIAWHPDRLSRNEIDASTITYLVRTGVIDDLKFGSYNFDNSPEGIMMLQLSLSQSQYFSSKLGKDVKRGLEKKFEMGWHPNKCPNGYINITRTNHGYSTIKTDEKRFKIMRKAFDLMLTGNYSVPEVLDKLNNEWGFKPKEGKNLLSRSALYRMFTNLFYTGIIEYGGKQKQGKHKPMITLEEYDRIQFLLGRNGKPRQRKNDFAYTGLIRCANCGCMISADIKRKIIKTTGEQKEYTYYCCTHKKKEIKCREQSVEIKSLEEQINQELLKYSLREKFKGLFFELLDKENQKKPKEDKIITDNLKDKINTLKIEKTNLTKLICKGLISDDEFQKQRNEYEKEISNIQQRLSKFGNEKKDERLKKVKFAVQAKINFNKGNQKDRREVLNEIGSNREIKDKKLTITPYKWLIPVQKDIKGIEAKFYTLELDKTPLNTKQKEAYTSLCRNLLAVGDSNWFNDEKRCRDLVEGWKNACNLARCVWGGGETPTLKGVVVPETIVLSGSAMGLVKPKERLITADNIQHGDAIVLIESSGIHANGLTMARKIADKLPDGYLTRLDDGRMYGETLLSPTHIYVGLIEDCLTRGITIHYAVNITGHGWRKLMRATQSFAYIVEKLPRQLPVFGFLQEHGPVDDAEAYGNFNMGAGFALYVSEADTDAVLKVAALHNLGALHAGHIERSDDKKVVIKPKSLEYSGTTLGVR